VEVADDLCCPAIQNCKVYGETCGQCDQICDLGHVENHNDVCVEEIDHCENYHDNGDCNYCESGYQKPVDNGLSKQDSVYGYTQCKNTCINLNGMLPCVKDDDYLNELDKLGNVWVGLHQPLGGTTAWVWEDGCDSN